MSSPGSGFAKSKIDSLKYWHKRLSYFSPECSDVRNRSLCSLLIHIPALKKTKQKQKFSEFLINFCKIEPQKFI
ncbi:hypothetical protein BpHYR1_043039 [Brachionus plicatilis]|uniref:Uncharacterized protein n=1 Tax=Brachionus plicatilis TaxID=10195 RepID=A0A3M7SYS8_BRAPC|nr:hypothetical protein BpHYR1_043039 [Brachionus plicatilis]